MSAIPIRRGTPEDVPACAAILNAWINDREWMPRLHTPDEVEGFYRDVVFAHRVVWVAGDPVSGFAGLDVEANTVTALYTATPGQGIGKALLDHVKRERPWLELWTFLANTGARRFYAREGFTEVRTTDGDNEEGLPDVLLRWDRAPIRMAGPDDVPAISRIVNDWIDGTEWMTRTASRSEIAGSIAEALPEREIFLIGDPVEGYLSLNPETAQIGALYVDRLGQGLGRALMERAKAGRSYLQLWTHEPNTEAHRFYRREGFEVVERNPKGGDGLPALRMEWRR